MKIAICGTGPTGLRTHEFLTELGAESICFAAETLLRVHKTFLGAKDNPAQGSRLKDLFRVVTRIEDHCERFQDFDLVIDARERNAFPRPMGPAGARALNEGEIADQPNVFYGTRDWEKLLKWLDKGRSLGIIGSGRVALQALMDLGPWVFENRISLVTTEEIPFQSLRAEKTHPHLISFWEQALDHWEREYKNQCEEYRQQLMEYREKSFAGGEPPREPNPPLDLLSQSTVVSIDRLDDQPGLFLTAEEAPFLVEKADHKTLHLDGVFVATGHRIPRALFQELQLSPEWEKTSSGSPLQPEPGLYLIDAKKEEELEVQLKMIEQDILSYFSRVK